MIEITIQIEQPGEEGLNLSVEKGSMESSTHRERQFGCVLCHAIEGVFHANPGGSPDPAKVIADSVLDALRKIFKDPEDKKLIILEG